MSSSRRRLLALPAALLLAGCGFSRRRAPRLAFASIALVGFAPRSPMAAELTRVLREQVQVLPAPERAEVVLEALVDARERSIVASTAAAQVREVQLRLRLNFIARTPSGRLLIPRAELLAARDLSTTESAVLAKGFEEAELYRELQTDVVQQVLRRLASIVP
ncbi:MAG: LPS assembly lipoprotein LptE [Burkholderiaceae bacterium]|jgi:LPS-assembly lipoprotein|nr:LPS assembly lipoprotein LptE [Burkholderiaceae bacterium]MCZ8175673.1 LPS assembly lipoprotein LptE [Burkholderiaceae bacterium]